MDPASLELEGAGTVDSRDRSVALLHPVDQPLDFTVTAERVPAQVSESQGTRQTYIFQKATKLTRHKEVSGECGRPLKPSG